MEHPAFHYRGAGHAFSGELRRPIQQVVEAQACVSLPRAGGHARARTENFQIPQLVSFAKGYSHVSGTQANGKHHTQSTVIVEHLNILDVVTADRMVGRLTSEHDPNEPEGHIIAVGSHIDNLKISGCLVKIEWDHDLFLKHKTYEALSKHLAGGKKSGKMGTDKVTLCSLAKNIEVACPGVEVDGHVITVKHFGKIFVGEVENSHGMKRMTMLRLELGSPADGRFSVGEFCTNGHP